MVESTENVMENGNSPSVTEEAMLEYMNSNTLFTKAWFVENAPKEFIQEWFNHRRKPLSGSAKFRANNNSGIFVQVNNVLLDSSDDNASRPRTAIHRRVSQISEEPTEEEKEQDRKFLESFERIDAAKSARNSITLELFNDILSGNFQKNRSREVLSREQLKEKFQHMTENELFMELISDITNELDMDTLCHKILVNICILTNSDRASLFLAKGSRDNRYLIPKLFDVTPDSLLEDAIAAATVATNGMPPLPFGKGIVGHVALSQQNVNIEDAYQDARFNKEIDHRTGYHTTSLMCQSIVNVGGDVIGVAECINKMSDDTNEPSHFTKLDEGVFQKYLTFCGIGIQNAQLFEMSVLEYKQNRTMLNLAKTIFEDTSSLDVMINKIMVKSKDLLNADIGRVYLLNTDLMHLPNYGSAKYGLEIFKVAFELQNDSDEVVQLDLLKETCEYGDYARQVAVSEKTLNFPNSVMYMDSSLQQDAILSVPILDNRSKIIGVAQQVKHNKTPFTEMDIQILEGFSVFCGLGIHSSMSMEAALKLTARQKISLEILAYHASSCIEETIEFMNSPVKSAEVYNIYSFTFDDLVLTDKETAQATVRMFIEINFLNQFKISYMMLCRWILSVRKNYRPVLYHNWRHALNVTQSMFIMLTTYGLRDVMTKNEQLALIVASMCHDLDHRGTNNSFQTKSGSPLATLYGSSIMENHHFYHCLLILNSDGNNILGSLSENDYKEVIKMIENCILSTDLEQYFKKKDKFAELVKSGERDWVDEGFGSTKKDLLRAMLMTACDLSAICKPWRIQKRVAEMVASEFFEQGDLEKEQLHESPIAMMDRSQKENLPKMQVGFIDFICLPLYQLLYEFWPALKPFLDGCEENRAKWEKLSKDKD